MYLAKEVLELCREDGLTLSTAESCTGGLIAKELTDISGASAVFLGGVVSYTNGVKADLLGVPRPMLAKFGAVSEQVARAMAEGVRSATGSDLALSVTGLAGPDGDDRGNPVGLVYIGLASKNATPVRQYRFNGDRTTIRCQTAIQALAMLKDYLEGV